MKRELARRHLSLETGETSLRHDTQQLDIKDQGLVRVRVRDSVEMDLCVATPSHPYENATISSPPLGRRPWNGNDMNRMKEQCCWPRDMILNASGLYAT